LRIAPVSRLFLLGAAVALFSVCVAAPSIVRAQSAQAESVEGRSRPEYDPLGIYLDDGLKMLGRLQVGRRAAPVPRSGETLGSFIVNTTMELETVHDSNVYRKNTNETSDTLMRFNPGLRVGSDWANHALNFSLSGSFGRYLDLSSEDYNDFNAGVDGKVDIDEGEAATLGLSWGRGHEARGSIDDQSSAKPTVSQNFNFNAGYNRDVGEIFSRTTLTASFADFFDNGTTNHDDRDVWTYTLRQRFGHDVDEGSQIFIEGAANLRDYVLSYDDNGKKLGSHGYEGLVGIVWDVSGVTFVEFGAGYLFQDPNDKNYKSQKGPAFRGRFLWNPTGVLTVSGSAAREVRETSQANSSGVLASIFGLRLDWEARYNLILSLDGGLTTEEVGGTNRSDDTSRMAFRWRWLIGQNWSLRGAAEYEEKTSTTANSGFKDMRFSIAIVERL
jgi:hypothetical protein